MAFGLAFASCDEVEEMTGKPQENPEIPGYDITKLQVTTPVGDAIDLPALNAGNLKDVAVVEVVDPGNLPEGYSIASRYVFSDTEDFAETFPVDVIFPDGSSTGYVTTGDIENAYEALLGLSAAPAPFYGRAEVFATNDKGSVIRLGGSDTYYAGASFTLTPDPVFVLYMPGDSNGWNFDKSMKLTSKDNKSFSGLAYLKGSFKFTSVAGWDGTNYGSGTGEGVLDTDGGASNLSVAEEGLYWVTVNTATLTYTLSGIASLGVAGSFNDWGSDVEMTHNETYTSWTADVTFTGTGEWKIRANGGTEISFGTSPEDMTFGGANIPDPGAGTYTVTFDCSSVPYKAMCVHK